ncbi:hypothetical protein GCM10009551_054380 [Nocardiopsis tropica]|uniref:hypothetical protein n=1 Tax=Tsukamurella strandjordii TaxID=147577 RepID=UPI0031DE6DF8
MAAETPGTIAAVQALGDARFIEDAWTAARRDAEALAIVECRRRFTMPDEQISSFLQLDLERVQAVRGIDIDAWYANGPDQLQVRFRNELLTRYGLDRFIVAETKPPAGSTINRLHAYVHDHPGVPLATVLALFEEDRQFGWDVAAMITHSPALDDSTGQLYPALSVEKIREACRDHEIWVAAHNGWALVMDAPRLDFAARLQLEAKRAKVRRDAEEALKEIERQIRCIGPDGRTFVRPGSAPNEMVTVWLGGKSRRFISSDDGSPARPVPPGWVRDANHGEPIPAR